MPRTVKRASQETPSIQSLDRGLVILEAVAKSGDPMSLTDLAALLHIDRSSVFRLANTLKRRGYLTISNRGKDYILGPSIWRLSRQYDWSNMLITITHEHLKKLALATNETAHLAVREGKRALFIDHATASHMISVAGQTGELVPLYCTAHGKALLAECDAPKLETILGSQPLTSYTSQTMTGLRKISKHCEEIKRLGYATDEEEFQEGIHCVAAPIHDRDGSVIASIGISAPVTRLPRERLAECIEQVMTIAHTISEAVGAREG